MPGRQSHSTIIPMKARTRKKIKSRSLQAHSIASQLSSEKIKIRQHRLGVLEGSPKHVKRSRDGNQSHNDENENEDLIQKKPRKESNRQRNEELVSDECSDSEGNKWKIGHVDSDDDSEIDSDDAFADSDEERFEGFMFFGSDKKSCKKSRKQRKDQIYEKNFSHSEPDSEFSDLGQDAVDLATMLDVDKSSGEERMIKGHPSEENISDSVDLDSCIDENSDDDFGASSSDDDKDYDDSSDPAKLAALQNLISQLPLPSEPDSHAEKLTTRECAKNLPSKFGVTLNKKITFEDLELPKVQDPHINRSLKILDTKNRKSTGKLEVPLERRQQERLDRDVAYQKSKKTLDRWVDTVKHNRRAEHITFPLPDNSIASAKSNRELAPVSSSKAHNELETAIQNILEESGLATVDGKNDEDKILELEELETKELSVAEVKLRRDQLRMARELLFREEARLKRIKKIKSRSYRKVHRKQREKIVRLEQQAIEDSGVLPSEDEEDFRNRRRAEERMRSRHKNSKWTKAMKDTGRIVWDENVRSEMTEMALRDDELRKRIEGKDIRKEYQDSDMSEDSDDETSEIQGISGQRHMLQKLEDEVNIGLDKSHPGARLANMNFMRKADLAQKKKNDAMIQEMKREFAGEPPIEKIKDDEDDIGRRIFGKYGDTNSKTTKDSIAKADISHDFDGGAWSTAGPKSNELKSVGTRKIKKNTSNLEELDLSKAELVSKQNYASKSILSDLNQELIQRTFAGVDVFHEFEVEKKRTIQAESDKTVDQTLPGWGSWIGDGITKKELKRNKNRFLSTSEGIQAHKRKDINLQCVIINESKIKKNHKYLASNLPHPFETKRQYERSLRIPIGPEWTTKQTFQNTTKPRILLKQGIITPISRPMM